MAVNHLSLVLLATLAAAQAGVKGYVVRVDSDTVWLDLTFADGAAPARPFEIYSEGAELKHPATGASLGRVREKVASGNILEVSDQFSIGRLTERLGPRAEAGLRARLLEARPPVATARPAETALRAPKARGAVLPYAATGMAAGRFDGSARTQLVLASENTIRLYAYPAADAGPLAEATLDGTGVRILGLEAANADADGQDELFVSIYDDPFRRFGTRVLKLEAGRWRQAAELPFLVRGYQDASGTRVLATQQIQDDKTFPFGTIYPLVYKDGKYLQGSPPFRHRRLDWIYGFTTAQLAPGAPALLVLTPVHNLRVQLGKDYWRSPDDDYGQTPVRVRWNDRLLEFHPPMVASYENRDFQALYAARNMAALGGLASPFGLFNRGELHRKRWNGLAFETDWKADLTGYAQGLAVVETEPGRREIAVAVIGTTGQSSVWTFEP